MHGLKEGDLRILLRQIADRDEGVGAVGERHPQHAGARAERGERLLRPQDREQARVLRGHHRRPRLDIAVGIGKERRALVLGGAFGQARGERGLPIAVGLQRLILEADRCQVGHERKTLFGERESGLPRLKRLGDEADGRERGEDGDENGNRAPEQLGLGQIAADALAESLPDWRRDSE